MVLCTWFIMLCLSLLAWQAWGQDTFHCYGPQACTFGIRASRITAYPVGNGMITPNADTTDILDLQGVTVPLQFAAPTGMPRDAQGLLIRIANATTIPITWDAAYSDHATLPLPTETSGKGMDYIALLYHAATRTWQHMATTIGMDEPSKPRQQPQQD